MTHQDKRSVFSSIIFKILIVNALSICVSAIALGGFGYLFFRNDSIERSARYALSAAKATAAFIDGNHFKEIMQTREKTLSWYHEKGAIQDTFESLNLSYLYVLDSDYDENVTYYLEADTKNSHFDLGETDSVTNFAAEMYQTITTGKPTVTRIYDSGDYGMLVSGFAAVWDDAGNIVGVVGADVSLNTVFSPSRNLMFMLRTLLVVMPCAFAPLFIQTALFRRMIGGPVKELTNATAKLGSGDLDVSLSIKTGDEIEHLSRTFVSMASQLKEYIANLTRVTAEKERIGTELNVATRIQASMLPCLFPAFPNRPEFDIYATMMPARAVGGDFYDFFLLDDDKLAVVVADVSGKGVPAALFMVIAKTLLKNNAQYGKSPKEVFETVNNLLYENNEATMFVTVFMGYLNISTGIFTYVNAGHNPPLLKRPNGQFSRLPTRAGFVLAGMGDTEYDEDVIRLDVGDTLYLYTDGVTEAFNSKDQLFTEERLLDVLNKYQDCELEKLLASIKWEIDRFADGVEQADDITMLALRITKKGKE